MSQNIWTTNRTDNLEHSNCWPNMNDSIWKWSLTTIQGIPPDSKKKTQMRYLHSLVTCIIKPVKMVHKSESTAWNIIDSELQNLNGLTIDKKVPYHPMKMCYARKLSDVQL